jgi:peroxiredoxin family protein
MSVYIVLTRNDPATLYVAAALTASYAVLGNDTTLFITGNAILAFRKKPIVTNLSEHELYVKANAAYLNIISDSKALGNVKVIACTGVMGVYGVDRDDLHEIVDDVLDFPTLISRVKDSDKVLVI